MASGRAPLAGLPGLTRLTLNAPVSVRPIIRPEVSATLLYATRRADIARETGNGLPRAGLPGLTRLTLNAPVSVAPIIRPEVSARLLCAARSRAHMACEIGNGCLAGKFC